MPVVMHAVLIQDRPQVPRPGDQHPIGDLRPDLRQARFSQVEAVFYANDSVPTNPRQKPGVSMLLTFRSTRVAGWYHW